MGDEGRPMARLRANACGLAFVLLLLVSGAARAQDASLVAARRTLIEQAQDARRTGDRALAESLRARVAHLLVRAPGDAPPGTEIRVAGAPLVRALWNAEGVVDPGRVAVDATAPGRAPFHGEVELAAGAHGELEVTLAP